MQEVPKKTPTEVLAGKRRVLMAMGQTVVSISKRSSLKKKTMKLTFTEKRTSASSREQITYTHVPSFWGTILLAASSKGICALYLSRDTSILKPSLELAFPNANLEFTPASNPVFAPAVAALRNPQSLAKTTLTLDVRGTEFQQQVWQAMCKTSWGNTCSYSNLATAIENPKAVRAVANACAANQISLLIPCHRIVKKSGNFSGYRWGRELKQALLQFEQQAPASWLPS